MDIISNENERYRDEIEAEPYDREEDWRPAPAVYPRRMSATLRWRWTVLIIAALSTLCWSVLVLIMVALLARL